MARNPRPFSPIADPAARRRRFAYPLVTLCVAGMIWLLATGKVSTDPQVDPETYEKFVTEVVAAAREGKGPLVEPGDLIARSWESIAPPALRSSQGGVFRAKFVDPSDGDADIVRDALAGSPVEVRLASGQGVYLYVRFVDGAARVVGVGALEPLAGEGAENDAAPGVR
ncbi:MAG: hypothetical protein ACKO3W_12730 [bacterium]